MSVYVRLKRWLRERRELKRAIAASRAHAMAEQMQCASSVPQCHLRQVAASRFRESWREPCSAATCRPKMCQNCGVVPLPAEMETCVSCLEDAFFVKEAEERSRYYHLVAAQTEGPAEGRCCICMESSIPAASMYQVVPCGHSFCRECLKMHVSTAIGDKKLPRCPQMECEATPQPQCWEGLLTGRQWQAVAQLAVEGCIAPHRIFCPHPTCSAPLLPPERPPLTAGMDLACPHCKQQLCVKCQGRLHPGMDCEAYRCGAADVSDAAVLGLAQQHKWKRCPTCQAIVVRSEACNHMTCLCGENFCYRCGKKSYSQNNFKCCR